MKPLAILALLCAIVPTGCVTVKKTYEYDPPPQVWQVNGRAVATLTRADQAAFRRIVNGE